MIFLLSKKKKNSYEWSCVTKRGDRVKILPPANNEIEDGDFRDDIIVKNEMFPNLPSVDAGYSRIYKFCEDAGIIVPQQSGFRNNKGAADNLVFFTQKISKTLNKDKKACGIFFDISKAFDKVWHNGLIYKLINLNVAGYMIKYIVDFL